MGDSAAPKEKRSAAIVAALVAAAIAALVATLQWPSPSPTPKPASADALIDRFEKVAFRDDLTPETRPELFRKRLIRWERPIRIGFSNVNEDVREHVESYVKKLQKLIGRRVWIPNETSVTPPNMGILLLDLEQYHNLFTNIDEETGSMRTIEDYFCFVDLSQRNHPYEPVLMIHFSPLYADRDFRKCVLEEIVQALGLIGDTVQDFNSLFVEYGPKRLDFPLNDKILLRTLYDPRLRDDMPRERAMIRVRQIIPELLAAYEAEGLEGLYQPLRDPSW